MGGAGGTHGKSLPLRSAFSRARQDELSNILRQYESGDRIRAAGLIERVGRTPLLELESVGRGLPAVSFYGKAEWCNPGGSVKDRAALRMIVEAELTGLLQPGKTILDATSGNTGIAYAWIGVVKGYRVRLVVPENAGVERKRLLRAFGATVVYTDPMLGIEGAIEKAREIYASDPDKYFYPDQYRNPANWKAHYDGTAAEIWEQTDGQLTHFVAGLGTSGTFVGTARRLKDFNPKIQCVSVEPEGPFHGLDGLKDMESAEVPGIYDPDLADLKLRVKTEDAYRVVRRLVREEGLLVGPSAGAALAACVEVARRLPRGAAANIVTILADSGDKYLSERFWTEETSP